MNFNLLTLITALGVFSTAGSAMAACWSTDTRYFDGGYTKYYRCSDGKRYLLEYVASDGRVYVTNL